MTATARGDAQAFSGLVDRHADRIMAFAFQVLGLRSEAEGVAQDVFVTLWQKVGDWRPDRARLSTWLFQITRNAALNYRQRTRSREHHWHDEPPDIASDLAGPEQQAMVEDEQRAVDQAIAALPEQQRSALLLVVREGLSNRDAATALDCSLKALEALLVRARTTTARRAAKSRFATLTADRSTGRTPMMTPDSFQQYLDLWGSRLDDWPKAESQAARSLLAESAQARAALADAERLTLALQRTMPQPASDALKLRLKRIPAHYAHPGRAAAATPTPRWTPNWWWGGGQWQRHGTGFHGRVHRPDQP